MRRAYKDGELVLVAEPADVVPPLEPGDVWWFGAGRRTVEVEILSVLNGPRGRVVHFSRPLRHGAPPQIVSCQEHEFFEIARRFHGRIKQEIA